jgi:dTDP-4-amino-4,6-dideoxy-D-galactose acyltransferase
MNEFLSSNRSDLPFFSVYSCLPGVDHEQSVESIVAPWLVALIEDPDCSIQVERGLVLFSHLKWDSDHFGFPVYRLIATFGERRLVALEQFISELDRRHDEFYVYADVASEHIETLQTLTGRGFRLVEPRITFVQDRLSEFDEPRYPVRRARLDDIPLLREVAERSSNKFDRVHADDYFSDESADKYLGTFVENSVRGFADIVLVPDAAKVPAKAFLAGNYAFDECSKINLKVSRFVLAAVHRDCAGWFRKLSSEMTYDMRDAGADFVLSTTQTANRAVIKAKEHLGFRLGAATHVLAYSRP